MPIVCPICVSVNSSKDQGQLRLAYDAFVTALLPEDIPCIFCASSKTHRHGSYARMIQFTECTECLRPQRRLCPVCGRTFALLPNAVAPYQRTAVELQDEVVREVASGVPYEAVADAVPVCKGPLSVLTLRRWYARATTQITMLAAPFTALVLTEQPTLSLPQIPDFVRSRSICFFYILGEQWLRAKEPGVSAAYNGLRLALYLFAPSVSVNRVSYGLLQPFPP